MIARICPGAVFMVATLAFAGAAQAQTIAIQGGTVHPVSGPPIENATVLIEHGEITAVGADVVVPAGVRIIDASGKVVTPGLFDASTQIGLIEVNAVSGTVDSRMSGDYVTAAFDVVDGINPHSVLIPVSRVSGVTTVLSGPSGGLIAGQAAVIDLAGQPLAEILAVPRVAMIGRYGPNAVDETGGSRGAASLHLREVLDDARFWAENEAAFNRGASRSVSHSRLDLQALQPVLAGDMPLVIDVHRASDIETVMRIADDYGIDLVVRGGTEAWMVAERLAAADVPVILKPLTNLPGGFDRLGARFDNAALLADAGVRVAISTMDTHNVRWLTLEAGNAVRFGLPWDAALRAVTLAPARILGIAGRYGSLEPGKVGNVVVWSGDPFELSSAPEVIVIRGEFIPDASRQGDLLDRYRILGDVPPAYSGGREPAETP